MSLLFDQNISFRIIKKVKVYFPGCKHVSDCGLMESDDLAIWEYAKKKRLAIVTFDADYHDFSLLYGFPPKIIWLRTGNMNTNSIARFLTQNTDSINRFLAGEHPYQDTSCLKLDT
jgi:predicted nuclease of predicted toxin-antitoxin system